MNASTSTEKDESDVRCFNSSRHRDISAHEKAELIANVALHSFPYDADVNNDPTAVCVCCDDCTQDCADDI